MTVATISEIHQNIAAGKGVFVPGIGLTHGTITAGAALSGGYTVALNFNAIGTTLPGTRVGFRTPPGTTGLALTEAMLARTNTANLFLCWVYTIGTVNLAATGDQFTHDAATFPLLRTEFGTASSPITLIPVIYVTTATTTTAAVFSMKTNAGGAGYIDQDGNNTVANVTMTMPAAATAVQSCFLMRLNDGDSGIRDVVQVDVDTAASAGAATIFGLEIIADVANYVGQNGLCAPIINGMRLSELRPAVATSGTVTAALAIVQFGTSTSGAVGFPTIVGVTNV